MKPAINKKCRIFIYSVFFSLSCLAQTPPLNIIPKPASLVQKEGLFVIDENTSIQVLAGNKELQALAQYFSGHISRISSYKLPLNQKRKKAIRFLLAKGVKGNAEGYELNVSPEAITISAFGREGVFYGLQSLLQMLPAVRTNEALQVPCLEISDAPAFGWRGLMLDVSCHFYPVETIKELIDLLALYKMNVFHWHLTDNEGWRLEIKKYPKLISVGAWRTETPGNVFYKKDTVVPTTPAYHYGGYYTQQEAKEVVAQTQKLLPQYL